MEFFKQNTTINFMAQRRWAAALSLTLALLSVIFLVMNGLNWGLDFTGGTQLHLRYAEPVNLLTVREALDTAGFTNATVIHYGNPNEILVTLRQNSPHVMDALPGATLEESNYIGPQVGQEMVSKGILAIIVAFLGTMIYIALRFNMRFAIGSTVALIHDPILILGIFALFHIEFNLITLAAVLTVIGYSLNDTIVIYDRVRENFCKLHLAEAIDVVNQAINQTLSRTIMTSALTLTVVLALFFLGGNALHGFALALMIGIIVGTYSSIYVAGSLTLMLGLNREHFIPAIKATDHLP